MVAVLTACGGSDADSAATTTSTSTTTTSSAAPTTAPTTTSSSITTSTTTTSTTTTTISPVELAQTLAESIVLPSGFFGEDWVEERRPDDDDFDYLVIDGCAFVDVLVDDDGSIAEAESLEFSQLDNYVEHDVRVYPDEERAAEVVVEWSTQEIADCLVTGAEIQAQADLDAGNLGPFTEVAFALQTFADHEGVPSFTNIEIENTLASAEGDELYLIDVYFIQVGEVVSRVEVGNPDELWDQTTGLLDVIVERMNSAVAG